MESKDKIGSDCIDRIAETRDENNEIRNAIPDFAYRYSLAALFFYFCLLRPKVVKGRSYRKFLKLL